MNICTHTLKYRRQFPYRWTIERADGARMTALTSQTIPDPHAAIDDIMSFASQYNAYALWASSPDILTSMLAPAMEEWRRTRQVPVWVGIDTLRAMLFVEYRSVHFTGGTSETEERMRALIAALHESIPV